ncbi:MAG: HAMP domain-containing histidine kinase [Planctomycetes bacterium]|nr:HAMP domain-containing histidine kinase [Planctomycetota bacterium]
MPPPSQAASVLDPGTLAGLIQEFNRSTEALEASHRRLRGRVRELTRELAEKNGELARRRRLAALGQMAAGVAHEIRNPLGGIQLCATLLERDLPEAAPARRLVERIQRGVQMLDDIVEGLLAFATDVVPDFAPVDLELAIDEAVAYLAPRLDAARVRVEHRRRTGGVGLVADRNLLQRLFMNLVKNAMEAMAGAGGVVEIEARPAARRVRVEVRDTGPGVPEAIRDRIFIPFFTSKDNGVGLGLSIVHRIVERHRGQVRVLSRAGTGAVFQVDLPLDPRRARRTRDEGRIPEEASP